MFKNREYQLRATRQGIKSFPALEFYRPAKRPDPRARRTKAAGQEQLTLNFEPVDPSANRPLNDVFPEAYE